MSGKEPIEQGLHPRLASSPVKNRHQDHGAVAGLKLADAERRFLQIAARQADSSAVSRGSRSCNGCLALRQSGIGQRPRNRMRI